MIDLIKDFLSNSDKQTNKSFNASETIIPATTALLVEAAVMDGNFHSNERITIERLITDSFDLNAGEAKNIIDTIQKEEDGANKVYSASQIVNKSLDYKERISIMEMVWEVILADGEVHDFESNLARRIAGLINVQDQDSGAAKKRVLNRINV